MPRVRVTKRVDFAAGHRLGNPSFGEEENRRIFGGCHNLHGHNYELEVTVEGEVDPETGYVIDLGRLKELLGEIVLEDVDHVNLSADVEWMEGINPTAENLVVQIWKRLFGSLDGTRLVSVKLWESARNIAEYRGE